MSYDVLHLHLIISIRHKGLRQYYEEGSGAKLPHDQLGKISRILDALDAVSGNDDIRASARVFIRLPGI